MVDVPPRTMQPTLVSSTRQAFDSWLDTARVAPLDIQQPEFAAQAAPLSGPPLSRHHTSARWWRVEVRGPGGSWLTPRNLLRPLVRTALRTRSLRQLCPQQIKHGVVDRDVIRTTDLWHFSPSSTPPHHPFRWFVGTRWLPFFSHAWSVKTMHAIEHPCLSTESPAIAGREPRFHGAARITAFVGHARACSD